MRDTQAERRKKRPELASRTPFCQLALSRSLCCAAAQGPPIATRLWHQLIDDSADARMPQAPPATWNSPLKVRVYPRAPSEAAMAKNAKKKKDVPRATADPSPQPATPKGTATGLTAEEVDAELEDALEHTFPASDPVAMQSTLVPGRRH
jgi:hypothetical protein